jgi:hypothetical protein
LTDGRVKGFELIASLLDLVFHSSGRY